MSNDTKSPRGRKPNAPVDVIDATVNERALTAAGEAAAIVGQRVRELTERFMDGRAYERHAFIDETRYYMVQGGMAYYQAGLRLLCIKESEPHGEFLHIVEGQLGLTERTAQQMMQTARRLCSDKLAGSAAKLLQLGSSKVATLLVEDDETLAAFADGGTVAGLTFDKVDAMGVRELRVKVRDQDATLKARDKIIKDKNAKIDQLSEQLHRRASSEPAEREAAQLELLRGDTLAAETALLRALATVDTVMNEAATEAAELAARQSLDYLVQKLVDACLSRGITVDLAERVSPIWTAPIKDAAKGKRA